MLYKIDYSFLEVIGVLTFSSKLIASALMDTQILHVAQETRLIG